MILSTLYILFIYLLNPVIYVIFITAVIYIHVPLLALSLGFK
jgi:hypothetical protein